MVFDRKFTGLYPRLMAWLDAANEPQIVAPTARLPTSASAYAFQSSTDNSTTTPLLSAATYTGTGETNDLPEVAVSAYADTAGTLYLQFKNPGSNLWHTIPASGYAVPASTHIMANALKHARAFRAKFVNAGGDQTTFELFTYYGAGFVAEAAARRSANASSTLVASDTSPSTLLSANANRIGGSIVNTDANALYILLGSGTVSSSLYTEKLDTDGVYEVPYAFTGLVTGAWAGNGAGGALVTDYLA